MKKYYIYYGTEENAYEMDKFGPKTLDEALDGLQEWHDEVDEEFDREAWKTMLSERGYDYENMENAHDYHTIMGIAEEGNLGVECYLNDLRNEFIGEFDDDEDC